MSSSSPPILEHILGLNSNQERIMAAIEKRDNVSNQLKGFSCSHAAGGAVITTSNGAPVDTITASLTAGPRGAIALKDFTLIDHLAAFDRERIPERVVHAKGAGAFGYFETTSGDIRKFCKAKLFSEVGKKTALAVRFSTVGGESGSADTARDPRGFAVKFYTEEGNWDLVGNNTPIFFIRDPILFPSFIHTQKRNPATHCKDPDAMWDFISLRPETTHQVSFLFSDRGTPDGYRFMNGYGSHTFKTVNENGTPFFVKWHFKTDQGVRNLPAAEADRLASSDPDYAIRDLFNAIDGADFPSWTLYFQVMTEEQAETCTFNPFDVTKVVFCAILYLFLIFLGFALICHLHITNRCGPILLILYMRLVEWYLTATRLTTSQRWNSWLSLLLTWFQALSLLRIRCCRLVYSATPTLIATDSVLTTSLFQ